MDRISVSRCFQDPSLARRALRLIGLAVFAFSCGAHPAADAPSGSRGAERCSAPLDRTSECDARQFVWAYDRALDRCFEYSYGGCPSGGSLNRFSSRGECERACRLGLTPAEKREAAAAMAWADGVRPEPLIVLGDTQGTSLWEHLILREDNRPAQRALFRQLAADSDRIRPAFVVHLGDSVTQGDCAEEWQAYAALIAPLRRRDLRVRAVLGNHDYWGRDATALALARRSYPDLAEHTYYADSHRGLGLIWLDTATPQGDAVPQLTWIDARMREFEEREDLHAVLAFTHHPTHTTALQRNGDDLSKRMLERLEGFPKFRALFSGHVHGYEHFTQRGRHLVVSGGAGGPRVDYRGRSPYSDHDHARFTLNRRIGPRHRSPLHYLILDWPELGEAAAQSSPGSARAAEPRITVTVRCLEQSAGCDDGVLDRFYIDLGAGRRG